MSLYLVTNRTSRTCSVAGTVIRRSEFAEVELSEQDAAFIAAKYKGRLSLEMVA